ncbi:MAG: archaemetzincin family Zn-dependent metalloprotease [Thermodesulfovibrionales bacterium]|nr:archaemetzincin family Zn-dependent metalloprotease [Thermodesulfovibrionales bacterium]
MRLLIIPIGAVGSAVLKDIADALEKTFHFSVELGKEMPIPHDLYNKKRGQYQSTRILRKLHPFKTKDFHRVLGIMDADLYVPELNFVFGEADILAGVTVIALARLRQEFYGLKPDKGLFHLRAIKEAIHEIGHTYGLGHCHNPGCIMYFSNSLKDTDRKGPGFCSICKHELNILASED